MALTHEVRLAHEGAGEITPASFEVAERHLPSLEEDEVLVRVLAASLDPYQRIRMRFSQAGEVPPAGIVGTVLESSSAQFQPGDHVLAEGAWADRLILPAASVTSYSSPADLAMHHAVGVLGLAGLTGYFGVTKVAQPRAGEKMVVTGAYGGVGQVAAQIARASGADVMGIAGGEEKVAALEALGVAALDYRDPHWVRYLEEWAPDGVDVFFDNVWGATAARVVEHVKPRGRVAVCGQISGLNEPAVPPLPLDDWFRVVSRSLTIRGFRAADYAEEFIPARAALAELVRSGEVRQDVQLVAGWAGAGEAFCDLLSGRTVGKLVVEVTEP